MGVMKMLRENMIFQAASRWGMACVLAVGVVAGLLPLDDGGTPASAAEPTPVLKNGFRRLAPGALTVIPPRTSSDSHALRGELYEVTRDPKAQVWTPKQASSHTTLVEQAKTLEFQRDIWCLEFAFKPPRLIDVDVPASDLRLQRKRMWYLVYRVRNTGGRRTVIDKDDPTKRTIESFETPVRFLPQFVLESREGLTEAEGETAYRSYLDRVVPNAMGPIRRREDPARELFDSASMAASDIPPGGERWGVAVWEDVDPRINFFTIFVRGLTNAIRWRPQAGATFARNLPPAAEMEHAAEALRLDFWRPGDDRDDLDEEMHVGYAGMLERMTLGGKLLEALGRPQTVKSRPVAGLANLGLSWADLVVPEAKEGGVDRGGDLIPLAKVVLAAAAIPEPTSRGPLVRAVFGDLGVEHFEELSRALAAPVDADRDAARRQALATIGLTPEAVEQKPLESLAKVFQALAQAPAGERQRRSEAFFGPAAPRVVSLSRELSMARTLSALEDVDLNRQRLVGSDGLVAFDVIREAIQAKKDPAERQRLIPGLFGPRGPALYGRATEVIEDGRATELTEGIDHAWVFQYEIDGD